LVEFPVSTQIAASAVHPTSPPKPTSRVFSTGNADKQGDFDLVKVRLRQLPTGAA